MRAIPILFFALGLAVFTSGRLQAQTITTIAGTGTAGYGGDGGPAVSAQINGPFSVATDTAGNIFIADRLNNRIRKIDASGIITTVAGTATGGYNGDNIAATTAQLNNPTGVFADRRGNLFIADRGNNRIRKVGVSGVITTVAGNGSAGFSGDGGPATAASLNSPRNIAVDNTGNVLIADQGNNRVRVVSGAGYIYTIAGTSATGYNGDNIPATAAQLKGPYGIAVDDGGNVFIADVDNYRVRMVNAGGSITTIAGTGTMGYSGDGGPATAASLNETIGMVAAGRGLFIADAWNNRIRYIDATGTIRTVAGNGTAGYNGDGIHPLSARLNNPYGIALTPAGGLVIADCDNARIRYIAHPVGINSVPYSKMTVAVSPNPCRGSFSIILPPALAGEATLLMMNMAGQVVLRQTVAATTQVNLTLDEPAGLYVLLVRMGAFEGACMVMLER